MPPFLLGLLTNARAWGALGVAALLALVGLQTARLHHAKADLAAARAALIDPASKRPWSEDAKAATADLATCHAGLGQLDAALSEQSSAVAALKAQGEADSAAAGQAVAQARARSSGVAARAAALLAAKPAASDCRGADTDALILRSLNP